MLEQQQVCAHANARQYAIKGQGGRRSLNRPAPVREHRDKPVARPFVRANAAVALATVASYAGSVAIGNKSVTNAITVSVGLRP